MSESAHSNSMLRKKTDAILLHEARNGNSVAFETLWVRHEHAVRVSVHRLARPSSCDVLRETRERLQHELRTGVGPESHFGEYTTTVARAIAAKWYRGPSKVRRLNVFSVTEETREEVAEQVPTGREVATAFAALPLEQQALLWLSEVDHVGHADIATRANLARFTVGSRLRKAVKHLHLAWLLQHLPAGATDPEIVSVMPAYLTGTLTKTQRSRVDAHVDDCESCAAVLFDLKDTNRALERVVPSALILTGPGTAAAILKVADLPVTTGSTGIIGAPEVLGAVASFGAVSAVGTAAAAKTGVAGLWAAKSVPTAIAGVSGSVVLAVGTAFAITQLVPPVAPPVVSTAGEDAEAAEPVSLSEPPDESIPKTANGSDTATESNESFFEIMPGAQYVVRTSDDDAGISIPVEVNTDGLENQVQIKPPMPGDSGAVTPGGKPPEQGDSDDEDSDDVKIHVRHSYAWFDPQGDESHVGVWACGWNSEAVSVRVVAGDVKTKAKKLSAKRWHFLETLPMAKADVPKEVTLEFSDADGNVVETKKITVKDFFGPTHPAVAPPTEPAPPETQPTESDQEETPAAEPTPTESQPTEAAQPEIETPEVNETAESTLEPSETAEDAVAD